MKVKTNFVSGVIAFGVIMAICYVAGSVLQVMLVSLLLAIILDPAVELLSYIRVPRAFSAFLMVLLMIAGIYLAFLFLISRADDFADVLPQYSKILRNAVVQYRSTADRLQKQTETVIPPTRERRPMVILEQPSLLSQYLFPGVQTVYYLLLMIGFIPFLVFFLLTRKIYLTQHFVEAFDEADRPGIINGLRAVATMVRSYLVANILVGILLSIASTILFLVQGLHFPIILGLLAGFLSLIPYLGVPLAAIGPIVVGLAQFHTLPPFLIMTGGLAGFHIIGLNFLFPKVVGARVNMNPVAVTLAILVWGWMWGAMGLILAIPITAGAKAVCDNIEGLQKFGRVLGE
jgi:predicted PurR-regulated permease PerM